MTPQTLQAKRIERSIPSLLRARRKELGLTLQVLADKAGLSAAFVSQAERGKAVPSSVSLLNLAAALGTDINYFLTPPTTPNLVRRAADPVRIEIDSPVTYYRLDGDVSNRQMNALLLEIPPGCELPKVHRESGEDFLYVLSGEISLTVGDETMRIGQGDSLHINSQLDHACANDTDQAARMIWVGTPSIFDT